MLRKNIFFVLKIPTEMIVIIHPELEPYLTLPNMHQLIDIWKKNDETIASELLVMGSRVPNEKKKRRTKMIVDQ